MRQQQQQRQRLVLQAPQAYAAGGGQHSPLHGEGGRQHALEPRSALALSCSDRPVADLLLPRLDGSSSGSSVSVSGPPRVAQASAPPPRLRIAVDVDEVLGRFVFALNRFCLEAYGMRHDVADYWVYEFAKVWGCSQDESNRIVHEFFASRHFNDGIPEIPGARDALRRLAARGCELVVVTSRQHVIQDVTLEWLDRHYAGLFSEVYFGNHFALQGASRKKSDICRTIDAHVLVDDNVGYALDCAEAGIDVLLYDWHGSYPWSKLTEGQGHPRITVVRDWEEAEAALLAMSAALVAEAA